MPINHIGLIISAMVQCANYDQPLAAEIDPKKWQRKHGSEQRAELKTTYSSKLKVLMLQLLKIKKQN